MSEKTIQEVNSEQMKERFQFRLTINDNIVCQRYFRINGFKNESKNSYELVDALHQCVKRIQNDLKEKSNIYNWLTSPQVYATKDEALAHLPMRSEYSYQTVRNPLPLYVLISETSEVYTWDGETLAQYNGYFNVGDYIDTNEDETNCKLKLIFMDGETEVISETFDGSCYQRFVRTNIDLSNSKNKYKQVGQYSQYEATIVDDMNDGREDLIPIIVRTLCLCCSYDNPSDYSVRDTYGNKKYLFNLNYANARNISAAERKYKAKTEKYFKDLY